MKRIRNSKKDRCRGTGQRKALFLGLLIFVTAFATACGGSSATKTSADSSAVMEETAAAQAMPAAKAASGTGAALLSEGEAVRIASGGGSVPKEETLEADPEGPESASERKLIRTIDLNVQTRDLQGLLELINERVAELGGYVESSWQSGAEGYSDQRSADIRVRMPAEKTDEFLDTALSGAVVTYRSETTEDVTLRYTDLEARMTALETEQDRLMELLAEADSIESVIAIESRLSEVRYEIESIGSQLRNYDNLVSYDTISISISEVRVIESGTKDSFSDRVKSGLESNISRLKDGATDFAVALIISLPFILILAAAGILIYIIVRMLKKTAAKRGLRNKAHEPAAEKENQESVLRNADDQGGKA